MNLGDGYGFADGGCCQFNFLEKSVYIFFDGAVGVDYFGVASTVMAKAVTKRDMNVNGDGLLWR